MLGATHNEPRRSSTMPPLSVDEALARILEGVTPMPGEPVGSESAEGSSEASSAESSEPVESDA